MVAYNKVHQVIWFDSVVEPSTNTQYKAALFMPADVCFCEVSYYPTYAFRGIIHKAVTVLLQTYKTTAVKYILNHIK